MTPITLLEAARYYRMLAQANKWPVWLQVFGGFACECGGRAKTPDEILHRPGCRHDEAERALEEAIDGR